jgi:hypothetical protein
MIDIRPHAFYFDYPDSCYPTNNQELFNGFVSSQLSLICEYSGSISSECKLLKAWSETYASNNNLQKARIEWEIYIIPEGKP